MATTKTPIRTVYDNSNAPIGLAEFQTGEVIGIIHGGTGGNTVAEAKLQLSLTDSNIRSLFSVTGGGSFNNTTGVITVNATDLTPYETKVNVALKANVVDLTTANITELNNLYYTDSRVYSNVVLLNYATTSYVSSQISALIDSAPEALNTLNELAAALGDDANYATTTATLISKANTNALSAFSQANIATLNASASFDKANVATVNASAGFDKANTLVATVAGVTATSITNAQILAGLLTVDGASSGLDADLLDGQSSSYYLNATNISDGTLAVERGGTGVTTKTGTGSVVLNQSPSFTGTVNVEELSASGNVTSPYFYSQSDINLKKDLAPITNALGIVNQLDGYWFKWKNNDTDSVGLIAQHVESVLPMLIGTAPDGSKTILYNGIISILLEAVKDQQKQIDELKTRL